MGEIGHNMLCMESKVHSQSCHFMQFGSVLVSMVSCQLVYVAYTGE